MNAELPLIVASEEQRRALQRVSAGHAKFNIGDEVWYRPSWGRKPPVLGVITGTGFEKGERVYDVSLDNGRFCWGYEDQFESTT